MKHISIGKRLVELQGEISARAFARKCNIPESTLRGYMTGKRYPPIDVIEGIATSLGITIEYLVSGRRQPITNLDKNSLLKIFELDPEVIEILHDQEKIHPVVKTYDDESSQLHFYCIHCQCWHHHGRGGKEAEFRLGRDGMAGDRVAHCTTLNSPFKIETVILDVVGKYKEIDRDKFPTKTLLCPNCRNYYSAAFNSCECGFDNKRRKSNYPDIESLYKENIHKIPHDNYDLEVNSQPIVGIENEKIGSSESAKKPTKIQLMPDKSMQEMAQWINEQNDGINYWEVAKAKLAQEFPDFKEWLKKHHSDNSASGSKKISVNE